MLNGVKVKKSEVKKVITAAFPNYKGRKVEVHKKNRVTLSNLTWCEGSRSQYVAVNLSDFSVARNDAINHIAPWENPYEGQTVEVPDGVAIVKHSIFQGRHKFVDIFVNENNFANLLPNHSS